MKYFLILLIGTSFLSACLKSDSKSTANTNLDSLKNVQALKRLSDPSKATSIQWIDTTYQVLGKVNQGQMVHLSWRFKNTGDKPLIVHNTAVSCGCTLVDRPTSPIAPNEEGIIKADFDTKGLQGIQRKEIYMTANIKGRVIHELSFVVDVVK